MVIVRSTVLAFILSITFGCTTLEHEEGAVSTAENEIPAVVFAAPPDMLDSAVIEQPAALSQEPTVVAPPKARKVAVKSKESKKSRSKKSASSRKLAKHSKSAAKRRQISQAD